MNIYDEFKSIIDFTKQKKFNEVRSLVMDNSNSGMFYSWFWKNMDSLGIEPKIQAQIIPDLDHAQDNHSRAANKQIPLMSFLVKMMKIL